MKKQGEYNTTDEVICISSDRKHNPLIQCHACKKIAVAARSSPPVIQWAVGRVLNTLMTGGAGYPGCGPSQIFVGKLTLSYSNLGHSLCRVETFARCIYLPDVSIWTVYTHCLHRRSQKHPYFLKSLTFISETADLLRE